MPVWFEHFNAYGSIAKKLKRQGMDIKIKIREAQKLIIDRLALCEESIAELYAAYSKRLPEMADFWQALSNEEKNHARLLKSLHKQLDNGVIINNIGRFDKPTIEAFITKIQTELAMLKESSISVLHATTVALSIEASIVDGYFYEIATSDAPEFKSIAEYLTKATHGHIELVQNQLIKQLSKQRVEHCGA